MRKLLSILPVIFLVGCALTPVKNSQSIVTKELTTLSGVTKAGALLLYAEDFKSQSNADFSKVGLRAVRLSLQNTSSGDTYQLHSNDIQGIEATKKVKQIDHDKAIDLMERSAQFIESGTESRVVKTVRNVTIGTLGGGIAVGSLIGFNTTSFIVAGVVGGIIGGSVGFIEGVKGNDLYAGKNIMGMIAGEITSGRLSDSIILPPASSMNGILLFPKDVLILTAKIKETIYYIDIH